MQKNKFFYIKQIQLTYRGLMIADAKRLRWAGYIGLWLAKYISEKLFNKSFSNLGKNECLLAIRLENGHIQIF